MAFSWPEHIFVTGTDTGIGKTVVSAILTAGLDASYWKPIQAGLDEETDTECVRRVAGVPDNRIIPETYRLNTPMSPHASAAIDGVEIDMKDFTFPQYETGHLVVEGAGGLLVPLNKEQMIIDLIQLLGMPVVLTARSELGTLNHTFLSLEALRNRGIPVLGVVLNGPRHESNRRTIEAYGQVDILAEIEYEDRLDSDTVKKIFREQFSADR